MSSRWSEGDVIRLTAKAPHTKYGAKKVMIDNILFDSKAEGRRYTELKLMRTAGLIESLDCHPRYSIDLEIDGKKIHICVVELDFTYWDIKCSCRRHEDVKGHDNPLSALKRKLVEAFHGIKVELIR